MFILDNAFSWFNDKVIDRHEHHPATPPSTAQRKTRHGFCPGYAARSAPISLRGSVWRRLACPSCAISNNDADWSLLLGNTGDRSLRQRRESWVPRGHEGHQRGCVRGAGATGCFGTDSGTGSSSSGSGTGSGSGSIGRSTNTSGGGGDTSCRGSIGGGDGCQTHGRRCSRIRGISGFRGKPLCGVGPVPSVCPCKAPPQPLLPAHQACPRPGSSMPLSRSFFYDP